VLLHSPIMAYHEFVRKDIFPTFPASS
jgi:hypothetical protein